MGKYLLQASYSQQAVSGLVKNPENRSGALNEAVASLGGKIISMDYCFGEYDVVLILETPDDTSMVAISMIAGASGAIGNIKTTVLLPMTEGFEAAKKAGTLTYRPPGQ